MPPLASRAGSGARLFDAARRSTGTAATTTSSLRLWAAGVAARSSSVLALLVRPARRGPPGRACPSAVALLGGAVFAALWLAELPFRLRGALVAQALRRQRPGLPPVARRPVVDDRSRSSCSACLAGAALVARRAAARRAGVARPLGRARRARGRATSCCTRSRSRRAPAARGPRARGARSSASRARAGRRGRRPSRCARRGDRTTRASTRRRSAPGRRRASILWDTLLEPDVASRRDPLRRRARARARRADGTPGRPRAGSRCSALPGALARSGGRRAARVTPPRSRAAALVARPPAARDAPARERRLAPLRGGGGLEALGLTRSRGSARPLPAVRADEPRRPGPAAARPRSCSRRTRPWSSAIADCSRGGASGRFWIPSTVVYFDQVSLDRVEQLLRELRRHVHPRDDDARDLALLDLVVDPRERDRELVVG